MDVLLILLGAWVLIGAAFFFVVRALGYVAQRADALSDHHAAEAMQPVARPAGRKRERRPRAAAAGARPMRLPAASQPGATVVACDECHVTMELPRGRAALCPGCRKLLVPPSRAAA
jgi:hypothetical protein